MSVFELKMPKLGESVTEGTIGKWLKQPGDAVKKYDLLVEVQTDKVNTEIPSEVDGTLREVKVKEGETVAVGTPLAVFEIADGAQPTAQTAPAEAKSAPAVAEPPSAKPAEAPQAQAAPGRPTTPPAATSTPAPSAPTAPRPDADVRATPAVRKLAAEHGVDLSQIEGTGLNGRVSRQDVEQYVAQASARPSAPAARPSAPPRAAAEGDELVPLTQMRKAIANAMVLSKSTIPHAAAMVEVDWSAVAAFRAHVKDSFKDREGFELTYLPFAMKAVCLALRKNPLVNASWTDKGVLITKAINLGVAISLEDEGLVVPVVKNADELSITGLARAVRDLATRARSKKLTLPDFDGGTFTVNNGGTFGTYLSYPIVNPGQAAIMTTEAIGKRVVVVDDETIGIRTMGNMVISFDHRVMDGATAARFMRDVKAWIQAVDPSNVSLG